MQKEFITTDFKQTQKLGEILAQELRGGQIVCLSGDLGAGKTTFTQGLLKGLGIKGPYTSPTFVIMKEYKLKISNNKLQISNPPAGRAGKSRIPKFQIQNIYHIDAYRVGAGDILNLGWEEIVADKNNVAIIEWAERIGKILPKNILWVDFEWIDEKKRKITFNNSPNF